VSVILRMKGNANTVKELDFIRELFTYARSGIVTVALDIACFFLLIDSPTLSGRWLKPDEIRFLELQRFIRDGGKFQEEKAHFRWKDLKMVLCN